MEHPSPGGFIILDAPLVSSIHKSLFGVRFKNIAMTPDIAVVILNRRDKFFSQFNCGTDVQLGFIDGTLSRLASITITTSDTGGDVMPSAWERRGDQARKC